MKATFLPAILPEGFSTEWPGKPISFLHPDAAGTPGGYPAALLSEAYWRGAEIRAPSGTLLFGDSGGFTIATQGIDLDPLEIIRWQLRTCSVGALLDVPPARIAGRRPPLGDAEADRRYALEQSVLNARRVIPTYREAVEQGSSFRFWGVFHGEDLR